MAHFVSQAENARYVFHDIEKVGVFFPKKYFAMTFPGKNCMSVSLKSI